MTHEDHRDHTIRTLKWGITAIPAPLSNLIEDVDEDACINHEYVCILLSFIFCGCTLHGRTVVLFLSKALSLSFIGRVFSISSVSGSRSIGRYRLLVFFNLMVQKSGPECTRHGHFAS